MKYFARFTALFLALLLSVSCQAFETEDTTQEPIPKPEDIDFYYVFGEVFMDKCMRCHHDVRGESKFDIAIYDAVITYITPGDHTESDLYGMMAFKLMPPKGETPVVTKRDLEIVRTWIDAGAVEKKLNSRKKK